VSIVKTEITQ